MPRSTAALLIGLIGLAVYVAVVMILGDWVLELHWSLQFLYFAVAGIAWSWPARRLIYWSVGR